MKNYLASAVHHYVTTDAPTAWEALGNDHGAARAAYQTGNLSPKLDVTCQSCGKKATKARGGEVLTRSTVVCGKCYRPEVHGEPSTVTNHAPTQDKKTCSHERRTPAPDSTRTKRRDYCLDCWATFPAVA